MEKLKSLSFYCFVTKNLKTYVFEKINKLFKHTKNTKKMSDLVNSYVPQVVKRKRNTPFAVRMLIQLLTRGDVHRVLAVRAIGGGALPSAETLITIPAYQYSHFWGWFRRPIFESKILPKRFAVSCRADRYGSDRFTATVSRREKRLCEI